ncbi:transcription regulator [Hyphodiscus hymeniophilus]|uniref:Transcription regulator n=1 Tax=Hyphodiscus hymeniophilus TaxID=353542 RepID=A0A9P7AZQ6_9HELO|nr:transcription regulator [Hyphodiscus hymeniophilus]
MFLRAQWLGEQKRHIKCDESKPSCLRCSNFGRVCEGYPNEEDNSSQREPPAPTTRKILSKAVQECALSSQTSCTEPPPAWLLFQDEADYHYFCLFRDKTSIELSAGFESTLWNPLVLQACDNSSILQLTIATAALSKAQEDGLWEMERSMHNQYALQQYGKALKGIQAMVSNGQKPMRIALIAALLIFCFESLLGDTGRAITPIQSSLDLIFKRLSTMSRPYRNSRTKPRGSPASAPIDEELLWAFMRLDGPPLVLLSNRHQAPSPPTNRIFTLAFHEDELYIPCGFATISEARLYLEDIKWRALPKPQTVIPEPDEGSPPNLQKMRSELKNWWSSSVTTSSSCLNSQIAQWHRAFEPLLEYSMTTAGESTFVAAATLYIQALSNDMVISGSGFNTVRQDMNSYVCANTIVTLSRRLVKHPRFVLGFVFDIGIIPALVIILMLCPDRDLKRATNAVLRDMMPRREGVWDSRIVAEAGEKLLAGEEEALKYDMIDPRWRSESPNGGYKPTLRQFLGA